MLQQLNCMKNWTFLMHYFKNCNQDTNNMNTTPFFDYDRVGENQFFQ